MSFGVTILIFALYFNGVFWIRTENFSNSVMADQNTEPGNNDAESNYSTPANDTKNMQEVTQYVQSLLQNMQDKFQSMSDQIINRIDEMGTRVDELEKNINDLMTQAGGVENEK